MYGWRLRIGIIIPSDNTAMESEFHTLLRSIQGVSIHASRVFMEELSIENLLKMNKNVRRAAEELKTAEVDVIAYGCTSGSFVKGLQFDKEIITEIETQTHIPATTTSTAVIEALKALHVKKVAVGTPYPDEINQLETVFLEKNGFHVTSIKGLAIAPDVDIGKQEPYIAYKVGKSVNTKDAECIFISCTDFRSIEIIDALEKTLGKPVISSNQSTLWHILTLANLGIHIKGYGTLLEQYV
jgi:maleate isomerase